MVSCSGSSEIKIYLAGMLDPRTTACLFWIFGTKMKTLFLCLFYGTA
jgi:hypothetical protein